MPSIIDCGEIARRHKTSKAQRDDGSWHAWCDHINCWWGRSGTEEEVDAAGRKHERDREGDF
jgi:hypothetical protein